MAVKKTYLLVPLALATYTGLAATQTADPGQFVEMTGKILLAVGVPAVLASAGIGYLVGLHLRGVQRQLREMGIDESQ